MDGHASGESAATDDGAEPSQAPAPSALPAPSRRARRRADPGTSRSSPPEAGESKALEPVYRIASQRQRPPDVRWVGEGNLFTFSASVPAALRRDILDSALLSQLAAQRKHSRLADPAGWHGVYQAMLGQLGWRTQRAQVSTWRPDHWIFSVEELIAGALIGFTTPEIVSAVLASMSAFDALPPGDPAVATYRAAAITGESAALQLSAMTGDARLVSVMVSLVHRQPLDQVFTQPLTTALLEGGVTVIAQVASLDEIAYARLRQKVIVLLGDRRSELLRPLGARTSGPEVMANAAGR